MMRRDHIPIKNSVFQKMDFLSQAVLVSKKSKKRNGENFPKLKKEFWKIVRLIREQQTLDPDEENKLQFHMKKMK